MGKKGARLTPGILRRLTARSLSGLPAPGVLAALRLLSMANSEVESSCSGCDGWPDSFLACKRAGLGLQWSDQATAIGLVWFGDRRARGFGLALGIRRVCWSATGRGRGRWTCVLCWCCCESRDGKTMDSGQALLRKVRAPQTPESSAQRTADKRQAQVRILGQGSSQSVIEMEQPKVLAQDRKLSKDCLGIFIRALWRQQNSGFHAFFGVQWFRLSVVNLEEHAKVHGRLVAAVRRGACKWVFTPPTFAGFVDFWNRAGLAFQHQQTSSPAQNKPRVAPYPPIHHRKTPHRPRTYRPSFPLDSHLLLARRATA